MPWDQMPTIIISSLLIFRNFSNVLHVIFLLHCQIILFFLPKTTIGNQNNNNKASIPQQSKNQQPKPPCQVLEVLWVSEMYVQGSSTKQIRSMSDML